mmetsp:Transcript_26738/g.75097  ORF Transcript_26738/g.75097 Transcript_26738/m.75097 type:complete len:88 (-) Transcript_26738:2167-2430(-)
MCSMYSVSYTALPTHSRSQMRNVRKAQTTWQATSPSIRHLGLFPPLSNNFSIPPLACAQQHMPGQLLLWQWQRQRERSASMQGRVLA